MLQFYLHMPVIKLMIAVSGKGFFVIENKRIKSCCYSLSVSLKRDTKTEVGICRNVAPYLAFYTL